jgi:hypothetical protein
MDGAIGYHHNPEGVAYNPGMFGFIRGLSRYIALKDQHLTPAFNA